MRVSKTQIKNGLTDFIRQEIIPVMGEDRAMRILLSVAVNALKANTAMLDRWLENDIARALIGDDGSGSYEIQPLMEWIRASVDEYGPLPVSIPPVPLISPKEITLRFGLADIDAIYRHIMSASE